MIQDSSVAPPLSADPRQTLNDSPMSRPQLLIVVIAMLVAAIEGYVVLSITLAAPLLSVQWHITKATLGSVIGAGFLGMGIGALFLGALSDLIGRRPLILSCLAAIVVLLLLSAIARNAFELGILRFLVGIAAGGSTSPLFAVVAEFSNTRSRSFAIAVMTVGNPIGGALGSLASAWLLLSFGWPSLFVLASILTAFAFLLYLFFVPESFSYLTRNGGARALAQINRQLARYGHPTITALPEIDRNTTEKLGLAYLLSPSERVRTLGITLAFCLNTITVFFLLSWLPQLVADMGFTAARASGVTTFNNVGGVLGSLTAGWVARRFTLSGVTRTIMFFLCLAVGVLGEVPPQIMAVEVYAFAAGFLAYGSMTAMYAFIATSFPSRARASGVGLAQAAGRATSLGSSVLAGFLFTAGLDRGVVAVIMAAGSLLAAIGMQLAANRQPEEPGSVRGDPV
jgi:MFS family permease